MATKRKKAAQENRYVKKGTGAGTGRKAEYTSDPKKSKYAKRRSASRAKQQRNVGKTSFFLLP